MAQAAAGQAEQAAALPRRVLQPQLRAGTLAADPDPFAACLDPQRVAVVADPACLSRQEVAELGALARAFGVSLLLVGDAELAAEQEAVLLLPAGRAAPPLAPSAAGPPIRAVTLHRVALPLRTLYVSALYVRRTQPRLVVEIELADGTRGFGEAPGGEDVARLLAPLARSWLGRDPLAERGLLRRDFARIGFANRNGRAGLAAFAALDLAAWDAAARLLGRPLAALLGAEGPPPPLPIAAPLPAAVPPAGEEERSALHRHMADAANAARIADLAEEMAGRGGITAFKWKSPGQDIGWDEAAIAALRRRLGPGVRLRHDPNAAFGTEAALALARRLLPYGLEFLEDPADGLEALARLARQLPLPIATNMAILSPADLAARYRLGAGPTVVLGDLSYWGGVLGLADMAFVCRRIGLVPALHSFYETAVATTAHAHLAAALGLAAVHPMDCGTPGLAADVVPEGVLRISKGRLQVPDGPGLGLVPDAALLRRLATAEPERIP